jgi:hypothetical protein
MKVYLVSSGSYSDYEIDNVFSTKEKAIEYIEFRKKYHCGNINDDFEEFDVDNTSIPYRDYAFYQFDGKSFTISDKQSWNFPRDNDILISDNKVHIKVNMDYDENVMFKSAVDKYFIWKATQEGIS